MVEMKDFKISGICITLLLSLHILLKYIHKAKHTLPHNIYTIM